jgi:hypothetical protein
VSRRQAGSGQAHVLCGLHTFRGVLMRACILHDQLRVPLLPPACSNVWLTSEQHLDINFNPASLLSMGDALAFMRSAQGAPPPPPPLPAVTVALSALDCLPANCAASLAGGCPQFCKQLTNHAHMLPAVLPPPRCLPACRDVLLAQCKPAWL